MSNNINNLNGGFNAVNFNGQKPLKEPEIQQSCDCPECEAIEAGASEALAAYNMPHVGKQCKPLTREELEEFLTCYQDAYNEAMFQALNQYAEQKYGA